MSAPRTLRAIIIDGVEVEVATASSRQEIRTFSLPRERGETEAEWARRCDAFRLGGEEA